MKKMLSLLLVTALLCGCAAQGGGQETEPSLPEGAATEADIAQLEALYEGREAYHGEFHDHADTGEKSDGKADLNSWKVNMAGKEMDFTTIVDHKQYMHMELPEWDESMFIGGSEPGTKVLDLTNIEQNSMHYNMIFATAEEFKKFLSENNEKFNFRMDEGGEGYFFWNGYEGYTSDQLLELSAAVREYGGFFNHNHPRGDSYLKSNNVLDYWYGDYTGFEVFCGYYTDMNDRRNQDAYNTWVGMLNEGKKVYATAGSDSHQLSKTVSLSTIYATERNAKAYLEQFRAGNFTAGPVGIRMSIGDTATGGETEFAGKRLVIAVGDFHPQEFYPSSTYRINVYNESDRVFSQQFTTDGETVYFALDTEDCKYYRAEIINETSKTMIAIGNPIWNKGAE